MKKFKVFSFLLVAILFSISVFNLNDISVKAQDNEIFTYDDYLKGIDNGWIGDDVSYEMLMEVRQESERLLRKMENIDEFYQLPFAFGIPVSAGDILVTNGTSSYGIVGHDAIVLNSSQVLHIQGHEDRYSRNSFIISC